MRKLETIGVACDHAAVEMKDQVVSLLEARGFEVADLGTSGSDPVDYPDVAARLGRFIQEGSAQRGVLLCGSGAGASIAANKLHGIRAAVCHDTYTAHQAVEHDDVNVLCMGARVIGPALAEDIVSTWVDARFSGEDRHVRRLEKIKQLEEQGAAAQHEVGA